MLGVSLASNHTLEGVVSQEDSYSIMSQRGAKVGLQLRVRKRQFILVLLLMNDCIFRTNSCKPPLPHPVFTCLTPTPWKSRPRRPWFYRAAVYWWRYLLNVAGVETRPNTSLPPLHLGLLFQATSRKTLICLISFQVSTCQI